tara:strand:+ start:325 stop:519 length:195 start_codon:yes stop_codon:yes gene_type:complete
MYLMSSEARRLEMVIGVDGLDGNGWERAERRRMRLERDLDPGRVTVPDILDIAGMKMDARGGVA